MDLFHGDKLIILDGGLGTMLQAAGLAGAPELAALEAPDILCGVHRAYAEAGASVLCANTFGLVARLISTRCPRNTSRRPSIS